MATTRRKKQDEGGGLFDAALVKVDQLPQQPSDVSLCIAAYYDGFKAKFGFRPIMRGGQAGRKFKDELIPAWGRDEVIAVIQDFFESKEPRIVNSDYSFGWFLANAQALKLRRAGRTAAKSLSPAAQANIEAARRVLGGGQ